MCCTGYLSSKTSCANNIVDFWPTDDNSGRQVIDVRRASGSGAIVGFPLRLVSIGRSNTGCTNHISLAGSVNQCASDGVQMGTNTSPGSQQWMVEEVEPGLYSIYNKVSV